MGKTAVIIGAGPAGLTAAMELLQRTDITPLILEASGSIGGISRTVNFQGNRIDLGGHRFFSKSNRITEWWQRLMPMQSAASFLRCNETLDALLPCPENGPDPDASDEVMLVRRRLSRILFDGKLFDYPLSLSAATIANLGVNRLIAIGTSYLKSRLFPVVPEKNLEDFYKNRFGDALYSMFFKEYTEKVWGVACSAISPDWGAQRVKGLSAGKAIVEALTAILGIARKRDGVETTLIRSFLYPKYGPGQLWEESARRIVAGGGTILRDHEVIRLLQSGNRISAVVAREKQTGAERTFETDCVLSSMALGDLIPALGSGVPSVAREVAAGLPYREMIIVGLLLRAMKPFGRGGGTSATSALHAPFLLPDTWLYIQEPHVRMGRIQLYNNWSPYMVADRNNVLLGIEFFCGQGDDFWNRSDAAMTEFGLAELAKLGLADRSAFLQSTVVRVPKAYPAYFGTYRDIGVIRHYLDSFVNFFPIGRNGLHKYNNMDHSMLTAMAAVDAIAGKIPSKDAVWSVNTETDYAESSGRQ